MMFLRRIDDVLNAFTMYRVVLYGLSILTLASIVFSATGLLPYSFFSLLLSVGVLLFLCLSLNALFAKMFRVPTNVESAAISALILYFLLTPLDSYSIAIWYIGASFFAMASKYLIAVNKKHVFNPVAFGVFAIGFLGSGEVIWWVGTAVMLPIAFIVGLLIVRKIRRFHLFFAFMASSTFFYLLQSFINRLNLIDSFWLFFVSFPTIFFATIMLTEPLTTPPKKNLQMLYGFLVGALFSMQFHIGRIYSTPELSLLVGNSFSYLVSSREKLVLTFVKKRELAKHVYEFVFRPNRTFSFKPGQYLEWTIPPKNADDRGNRRYFTIASSPSENEIKVGIHMERVEKSSSFKRELSRMKKGDTILAAQLAGDFTLPNDEEKFVFIAGGIGITPFRSMIKYLIDKKLKTDIVLIYSASSPEELAYTELFAEAEKKAGVKVIYLVTNTENSNVRWTGKTGRLNEKMLKEEIPDFAERVFYLSGPNRMVVSYTDLLHSMGVHSSRIRTDYFPGF